MSLLGAHMGSRDDGLARPAQPAQPSSTAAPELDTVACKMIPGTQAFTSPFVTGGHTLLASPAAEGSSASDANNAGMRIR